MNLSNSPRRMRVVAGLVGGGVGLALVTGLGPAPSLLAGASGGASGGGSTSSTSPTTQTTASGGNAAATTSSDQVVDAAGAGTVTVRRNGAQLTLVSAVPARGWRVEVEQAAGVEIEVDFRQGTRRVQVNLELEDGAVRERIRIRDDADGTDVRFENGVLVRAEPGDRADDRGDDRVEDRADDRGGDRVVDDVSNSGPGAGDHGADDPSGDDHGGNSGPGGGGHGGDGPAGDDHGGTSRSDG
jgi:hypothetical protein